MSMVPYENPFESVYVLVPFAVFSAAMIIAMALKWDYFPGVAVWSINFAMAMYLIADELGVTP